MTWHLDPTAFAALIADAVRAPSLHNSQPWQFRLTPQAIELLLDPDRVLPVGDPTGRAARMSCGAALYNLRLALAQHGTPAVVALTPDPRRQDLLARLTPSRPRPATPLETRLYAAIPRRHSNRLPFAEVPVPVDVRTHLIDAARAEGAWLDLLIGPVAVETIAKLTGVADEILNRDEAYRTELKAWTRTAAAADDGVPTAAGGPAPRPYELLVRRDFGGEETTRDYERDPLIAVIGGFGDHPNDDVQIGMALQRVLLTATDLGLASSMFSQPIDVPAVREELRLALGRPYPPHMLLRFGYAVSVSHTARRPAEDVITPE